MGNEIRGGKYWLKDKENAGVCGGEVKDWEHVLERCMRVLGRGG